MNSETCWTLIQAVHQGDGAARDDFVERYLPSVHAYLRARWSGKPLLSEVEDAEQEVLARCFSESGPLGRLERASGGFRGFLYGVCRNVAREYEHDRKKRAEHCIEALDDQPAEQERLSEIFDREFARQVMREARARFREQSLAEGGRAARHPELLKLRFEDNLPIRSIAAQWGCDPAQVHKDYARARKNYREVLLDLMSEQNPGRTPAEVEQATILLLALLS